MLPPQESQIVTIPYVITDDMSCRTFLLVWFTLGKEMPWADRGHVLAQFQFELPVKPFKKEEIRMSDMDPLTMYECDHLLTIEGTDFKYVLDKVTGMFTSIDIHAALSFNIHIYLVIRSASGQYV